MTGAAAAHRGSSQPPKCIINPMPKRHAYFWVVCTSTQAHAHTALIVLCWANGRERYDERKPKEVVARTGL